MAAFRRLVFIAIALTFLVSAPAATAVAGTAIYFPETRQQLSPYFSDFFFRHGGVDNFGFPISADDSVNGVVVQYFERARMEYHPADAQKVQLGLVGREATAWRDFPECPPFRGDAEHAFFPQTGHSISNGFFFYWLHRGGAQIFGYPISEEFTERNSADGKIYTVQYFERARFEYHPEFKGTSYEVELGLLGRMTYGVQPAALTTNSLTSLEVRLLDLTNQARADQGLGAVQPDRSLTAIARTRSDDMASRNYFGHRTPEGKYFENYLADAGIGFQKAGEILAENNYNDGQTASVALDGFLHSQTHRDVLLDGGYTRAGVGHAVSSNGMHYFTMIFLR